MQPRGSRWGRFFAIVSGLCLAMSAAVAAWALSDGLLTVLLLITAVVPFGVLLLLGLGVLAAVMALVMGEPAPAPTLSPGPAGGSGRSGHRRP
jgi:hypothetical protein